MKTHEALDVLKSLRDPFNNRLDREICDKNGHVLKDGSRPVLGLRCGEMGKLISSINFGNMTYMGDGDYYKGHTLIAYNLNDAFTYALSRTSINSGGGRYSPVDGKLLSEYNYGFPFVIAIDMRGKSIEYDWRKPGELSIRDPILLRDIVMFFGIKPTASYTIDTKRFVNKLGELEESSHNRGYIELLKRFNDADEEDVVVTNSGWI